MAPSWSKPSCLFPGFSLPGPSTAPFCLVCNQPPPPQAEAMVNPTAATSLQRNGMVSSLLASCCWLQRCGGDKPSTLPSLHLPPPLSASNCHRAEWSRFPGWMPQLNPMPWLSMALRSWLSAAQVSVQTGLVFGGVQWADLASPHHMPTGAQGINKPKPHWNGWFPANWSHMSR